MKPTLILSLLLLAAPPSHGDDPSAWPAETTPETATSKPAPQLVTLERLLLQKQEARDAGTIAPAQYHTFVSKFRANLDATMARIQQTPANKGLHAQILARLGVEERGRALSGLAQALESSPTDPELLRARGQILYEQRDFPAAAESARLAWEASGHTDKAAWALLKMSEGRMAPGSSPSAAPLPAPGYTANEWTIPRNHDISPQAMGFVRESISARRQGDMASTWANAQAAMNVDPTSVAIQKFYDTVKAERTQHIETKSYIEQAVKALGAGHGDEAVSWAQKAYDRSPSEDTKSVLEDVRRRSSELGAKKTSSPAKDPNPGKGSPLLPLLAAGGAGLTALGLYKVALSRGTESSDEGLNPSPELSPEQSRRNYLNSAVLIGTPIVVAALVYGGPIAWQALAPAATGALHGGRQSFQRVAASETGALIPGTLDRAARQFPGFTASESQIIAEAQQVLSSPQFIRLQEAYRTGNPTAVKIGERVIQYEPDMPPGYSGMALFKENGFVLGRAAFKSTLELQKTVLHELHRLATTQSAGGVDARLAKQETDAAFLFAERAAGALKK